MKLLGKLKCAQTKPT